VLETRGLKPDEPRELVEIKASRVRA
jgi:hypothetical protein